MKFPVASRIRRRKGYLLIFTLSLKIDVVVLGRAALADPEYPNKVMSGHTEKIRPCIACNQGCITRLQQGKQPSCAVNPAAMREVRYALRPCVKPKKW